MPAPEERVEVRPSGWFLLAAGLSPGLLVGLGLWGLIAAGGWRTVPVVLLIVGAALSAVVAFDLPYRCRFGPEGVERVCLLRRQHVAWDDVIGLTRTRVDQRGQRLMGRVVGGAAVARSGGLVALVGPKRRRYLLSDRAERRDQFDQLQRQLGRWAPGVALPDPPR